MSASRLAIMAGLLTLALAPGTAPAARKLRPIEPPPAPQKLAIAQGGTDFFIRQPRTATRADKTVEVGSAVRFDQRLLTRGTRSSAGDVQ